MQFGPAEPFFPSSYRGFGDLGDRGKRIQSAGGKVGPIDKEEPPQKTDTLRPPIEGSVEKKNNPKSSKGSQDHNADVLPLAEGGPPISKMDQAKIPVNTGIEELL